MESGRFSRKLINAPLRPKPKPTALMRFYYKEMKEEMERLGHTGEDLKIIMNRLKPVIIEQARRKEFSGIKPLQFPDFDSQDIAETSQEPLKLIAEEVKKKIPETSEDIFLGFVGAPEKSISKLYEADIEREESYREREKLYREIQEMRKSGDYGKYESVFLDGDEKLLNRLQKLILEARNKGASEEEIRLIKRNYLKEKLEKEGEKYSLSAQIEKKVLEEKGMLPYYLFAGEKAESKMNPKKAEETVINILTTLGGQNAFKNLNTLNMINLSGLIDKDEFINKINSRELFKLRGDYLTILSSNKGGNKGREYDPDLRVWVDKENPIIVNKLKGKTGYLGYLDNYSDLILSRGDKHIPNYSKIVYDHVSNLIDKKRKGLKLTPQEELVVSLENGIIRRIKAKEEEDARNRAIVEKRTKPEETEEERVYNNDLGVWVDDTNLYYSNPTGGDALGTVFQGELKPFKQRKTK